MTRLFFEMNAFDINTRIADEGRVPLVPLVHAHELAAGGVVLQDDNVNVTAALVDHPPIQTRVRLPLRCPGSVDRDFRRHRAVEEPDRARQGRGRAGARSACGCRLWIASSRTIPNATTLKQHIIDSHTSAEDCGRVAAAAGVKTLVLSHLVPPDDPAITDQMWIDAAKKHFSGRIVCGQGPDGGLTEESAIRRIRNRGESIEPPASLIFRSTRSCSQC